MGMTIHPWDEKSKKILDQIVMDGKAYTDDIHLSRKFGQKYPELINLDFVDISRASTKNRTWFVTYPNVRVKPGKHKYDFFKIW